MIKAVLFDLDDTLVSLNLTAFLARYVNGVSGILREACGGSRMRIAAAYAAAWMAVEAEDRRDRLTNAELIEKVVEERCGIPVGDPAIRELIACFEREIVPRYGGGVVRAEPKRGALEAVRWVQAAGLKCALATNPVVSLACDQARMAWAGVGTDDFELVTAAENSHRAKPWAGYYQEVCAQLGVGMAECLMVGNDARRDFAHPECGLRTIYVGHARPTRAVWAGPMERLAADLPAIIDACNG